MTKVWYRNGPRSQHPGTIESYAGEGYYWVKDCDTKKLHYCFMLEIQKRN